jgi:hypothetical protein
MEGDALRDVIRLQAADETLYTQVFELDRVRQYFSIRQFEQQMNGEVNDIFEGFAGVFPYDIGFALALPRETVDISCLSSLV